MKFTMSTKNNNTNYESILLNNINCEYKLENHNIFFFHPANNLKNIFQLFFSKNKQERIRGSRLLNKLNKVEHIPVVENDGSISDLEYLNILLDHGKYEEVEIKFKEFLKRNSIFFTVSENGVEVKNTTEEIRLKILFVKLDYFYRKSNRLLANLILKSLLGVTDRSMRRLINYYNLRLNDFYEPFDHRDITVDCELPLKFGYEYFFAVADFLRKNFGRAEAAKIFYENGFFAEHIATDQSVSTVDMYISLCSKLNKDGILNSRLSKLYFERGLLSKSLTDYEKSMEVVENPEALIAIGKIYWEMNENEKAERYIKKSLEQGRKTEYLFTFGSFLLSIDRNGEAENIFKELELLDKHSFKITYNLALAFLRNGKYEMAYEKFRRVQEIRPSKSVNLIMQKIESDFLK